MKFASIPFALAILFALAEYLPQTASTQEPKTAATSVALKVVKLTEFTDAIKAQKGKIVVVDFWGTFCLPCKKEFPHLVELHNKYGKDVACISVSVDEVSDNESALKFLQKQKATFANYLLDDEKNEWQKVWKITAVPAVMVYDTTGKLVGRFNNDDPDKQFTYTKDVEPFVQKLLKK